MPELRALLENSKPGDLVTVHGYTDSKGKVSTITVLRLEHDDYRNMQAKSLRMLKEEQAQECPPAEAAALAGMINGLETILFGEKTADFRDIYRDAGGFYVHKDSGTMDEIYLLRLAELSSTAAPVIPKSIDAQMKRNISNRCRLPTSFYRHALKFSEGSFSSVSLLKFKDLSEEQISQSDAIRGKDETNETTIRVS